MRSILGATAAGAPLALDLEALIGSHLCVAANSGGGKSGAIRKLLEATYGQVQHIVLDAEDEFYTLRERFDYVIAGGDGGDAPATVANARGLADAALAHDFSLIVQINDLGDDAGAFIAEFLDALISAPREQWRPLLVVIDEAQHFAPSNAPSVATAAIKNLLQRGRKRGFTAVVASTRISELHPGVRGLARNWMLGLVGQSLDRRTAADQLGFAPSSAEARGLQYLEPRQFWGFGPALSRQPALFTVGDVETTIVKSGQAKVPTPPAPEALRAILSGLTTAPLEVAVAPTSGGKSLLAGEMAELFALRAERNDWTIERAVGQQQIDALTVENEALRECATRIAEAAADIARIRPALNQIPAQGGGSPKGDRGQTEGRMVVSPRSTPRAQAPASAARTATEKAGGGNASPAAPGELNGIAQTILLNLRLIWPARVTWAQAAHIAGRSPKSGPYFAAKKQLVAAGAVHTDDVHVWASGEHGAGLPRDEALAAWCKVTDGFAPRMLGALADGALRTRDQLGEQLGLSTKSGPWFGGLKTMRERGLIEEFGNQLRLANPLPGEKS